MRQSCTLAPARHLPRAYLLSLSTARHCRSSRRCRRCAPPCARSATVVLEAPPGAGKSTVVPLALLDEPTGSAGRRILLLQPRRIAARAVARRMAQLAGSEPGQLVGLPHAARVAGQSAATRIEVVTEGILTRMLQADPALEELRLRDLRRVPRAQPAVGPRARARAGCAAQPARGPAAARHVGNARWHRLAARRCPACSSVRSLGPCCSKSSTHYVGAVAGGRRIVGPSRSSSVPPAWCCARSRAIPATCWCSCRAPPRSAVPSQRSRQARDEPALLVLPLYGELEAAEQDRGVARRRRRASARSSSRPTSPKRASRSKACESWSMPGSSDVSASTRTPA